VSIGEFIGNNIWLVLAAVVSGGYFLWPWISRRASGVNDVGPIAAVQLINRKNAVVLDVQEEGEFNGGHISGAKNFPAASIEKRAGDLKKYANKPVLISCASGARSHVAYTALRKQGFQDLHVLSGGLGAWKQANLPVEKS
jgi:rhodanese-related sulfurtransferase